MSEWVCYLIMSLQSNETYVGSTNNILNRLNNHNNNDPSIKRRGARRTRGRTWVPILFVSGFENKNACLSFESGFKRLSKNRSMSRLQPINLMTGSNLSYESDPKWNRIMDLLYFIHNTTLIGTQFRINHDIRHPVIVPDKLTINIMMENWISDLPWPYFIECRSVEKD